MLKTQTLGRNGSSLRNMSFYLASIPKFCAWQSQLPEANLVEGLAREPSGSRGSLNPLSFRGRG